MAEAPSRAEGVDFLGARIIRDVDGIIRCDPSNRLFIVFLKIGS